MHNPVTATLEPTAAGVARPPAVGLCEPGESRFAPLFSRTVERSRSRRSRTSSDGRWSACSCPTASCSD